MRRHRLRGRPGERRRAIRATVGAALVAVAALAGCGVGEPQPDTRPGVSSQGLEAFRAGLYAFAAPPTSCGQCHAVGHVPLFASPEIHAAYAAAKLLVDFAHPTGSLLITYSQNNHCGMDTMCGADSGNGEIVQRNLIEWADAELGAGSGGGLPAGPKFATASIPIPDISTLPTLMTGKPALLRFPLSDLAPPVASLGPAILELELVLANPTEYRFANPKIAGNTAVVQVTGVHVFVKPSAETGLGSEDANQGDTWNDEVVSIPISTLPAPLPTTPLGVAPFDARAIGVAAYTNSGVLNDTVTVGFDGLQ